MRIFFRQPSTTASRFWSRPKPPSRNAVIRGHVARCLPPLFFQSATWHSLEQYGAPQRAHDANFGAAAAPFAGAPFAAEPSAAAPSAGVPSAAAPSAASPSASTGCVLPQPRRLHARVAASGRA